MRIVIKALLVCFLSQPVHASNVKALLDVCVPWAETDFSSQAVDGKAIACLYYFTAAVELSQQYCTYKRDGYPGVALDLFAADVKPSDHKEAVIKSFIDWATINPESWSRSAIANIPSYIPNKWPCE